MRSVRLLVLASALAACGGSGDLRISEVQVVDLTAPDPRLWRPDADELERLVRTAMRDPAVGWGGDARGSRKLRAEIALVRSDVGERGVLRAEIVLRLDPADAAGDAPIEASGIVEKSYATRAAVNEAFVRRHLERGLRDVAQGLFAQVHLLVGDPRGLLAALLGNDAPLREAAIRAAATRRERAAVPALIKLLGHADEEVSDAAIGALVAIGDRRAVRPLCERSNLGDARGVAKVLDAIASLGGEEARAYLELVGSGHDDPAIKAMAREALDRLTRHRR